MMPVCVVTHTLVDSVGGLQCVDAWSDYPVIAERTAPRNVPRCYTVCPPAVFPNAPDPFYHTSYVTLRVQNTHQYTDLSSKLCVLWRWLFVTHVSLWCGTKRTPECRVLTNKRRSRTVNSSVTRDVLCGGPPPCRYSYHGTR